MPRPPTPTARPTSAAIPIATPAPGPPPAALTTGLLLAMSLHAIHGLAVVTVLPVIVRDLGRPALYGAVLASYLLASLVGLAWSGRESDRRGLARPFGSGLAVFAAGLCASGLAPSMPALVAARALEGLGGGMLSAVLFASVNRAYPEPMRPRVLAWLAAAWIVPGLLAPPLAGLVAERFGWRSVLLGLLPLVALAAPLAWSPLARLGGVPSARGTPGADAPRVSAALALAAGVGLAGLASAAPLPLPARLAGVAAGLLLAFPALRRVLPDGTLRLRRGLPAAIAAKLGFAFSFFAVDAYLPLALTGVHGRSVVVAGFAMTLGALCWTSGSFAHARSAPRIPGRAAMLAASAVLLAGIGCVAAGLRPGASPVWCFAGFGLAGVGMGAGTNAASVVAMSATPAGREGATSTALGLGDALGVCFATGIGGAAVAFGGEAGTATSLAGLWALAGWVALGVALAGWRSDPAAARAHGRRVNQPTTLRRVRRAGRTSWWKRALSNATSRPPRGSTSRQGGASGSSR